MQKIKKESHISDEELASFIDNRLHGREKEKVKKHIVTCSRCRLTVVGAIKEKRKRVKYSNNIFYIGAMVASVGFILFMPMFDEQTLTKGLEVSKISLFDMIVDWIKQIFFR